MSLFAVYGNRLYAADITYHWGIFDSGNPTQAQTIAGGTTTTLTNMDMMLPGYVIIGWTSELFPMVVMSPVTETLAKNSYGLEATGSSFTATGDATLYAVWALDRNNDGYPDYSGNIIKPSLNGVSAWKGVSVADEDDGISLRSFPVWDNNYDRPAYDDRIYYVGCTYNRDTVSLYDSHIVFGETNSFDGGSSSKIVTAIPMQFVIEYDGVLEDGCMTGGPKQEPLTVIEIPANTIVKDIFETHPFMFTSIKKDGQGILRMYFIDPVTGTHPIAANWNKTTLLHAWWGGNIPQPFINSETGAPSDTFTVKFNIYNKPEFESGTIKQSVDLQGYINLKHVKGTPLKYMMRSINGLRWQPAGSPLTGTEKAEIGDSVNICLRELDPTIGFQMFQKDYYFTDEFNPTKHLGEFTVFSNECLFAYNESVYATLNSTEKLAVDAIYPGVYALLISSGSTPEEAHDNALYIALASSSIPSYNTTTAFGIADSTARADWYTVFGQRKADAIVVPDPCRETFCFVFEKKVFPTIRREIYMPQVGGVTTYPEFGAHYVQSQDDFGFTARYASGEPMLVKTGRTIGGVEEVLAGTLNENGEYEYVVRKVTENLRLTFTITVDNASVDDGRAVWSYNNMIYIRTEKEDVANIYSVAGQLVKRIGLSEGQVSVPVEYGVYIVTLKDGSVHKVIVK